MRREDSQMLTHTTAKSLQEEMVRRARRLQGIRADRELCVARVDWRRSGAAFAAAVAVIAIVAANAMGPTESPARPGPAAEVNEFQGGTSGVPLKTE